MIVPAGYYPFAALLNEARDDSLYDEAERFIVENTSTLMMLGMQRRDDIILSWVFDYCGKKLFVTSPGGTVCRIDESILRRNNYYVDLASKSFAGDDAATVPARLRQDFNFCEPLEEDEFEKFNILVEKLYETEKESERAAFDQLIKDQVRELSGRNGYTRPPIFFEAHSGKIDLRLFWYLFDTDLADGIEGDSSGLFRTAKELERVEGWTIAMPESLVSKDWEAFCEDRATKHKQYLDSLISENSAEVGRPRKRERAAKAFMKMYPEGIGRDSWVQAAHKISRVTGESVSVDTLKRGLGKK